MSDVPKVREDWETAQKMVADAVGGKVTPGSGNGRIKGDVQKEGWGFEVKQYADRQRPDKPAPSYSIKKSWFNKLVHQCGNDRDVCLVIFVALRGVPYFRELIGPHKEDITWKSISCQEGSFPEVLYCDDYSRWVRGTWADLISIRHESN